MRAPDRRRGEIFIQAGLKLDVVALEELGGFPQREIETAERRAAIAGHETGGVQTGELVALMLNRQQANQRLNARDEDASGFQFVFVVERDVAQRGARESDGRGHVQKLRELCSGSRRDG